MIDPMQFLGSQPLGQQMVYPPVYPRPSNRSGFEYPYWMYPQMMPSVQPQMAQFMAPPGAPVQFAQTGPFENLYNTITECDRNGGGDTNSNPELRKHFPFMRDNDHIVIKVFLNSPNCPSSMPIGPEQFMHPQSQMPPFMTQIPFQANPFQYAPSPMDTQRQMPAETRQQFQSYSHPRPDMHHEPMPQEPAPARAQQPPQPVHQTPSQQNWIPYITPNKATKEIKESKESKEIFENRILNDPKPMKVEPVQIEEARPKPPSEPSRKEVRLPERKEIPVIQLPISEPSQRPERPTQEISPRLPAVLPPPPSKEPLQTEVEKMTSVSDRRGNQAAPSLFNGSISRHNSSELLKVSDKETLKTKDIAAAAYVLSKQRMSGALVFPNQQPVTSTQRTKKIHRPYFKRTGIRKDRSHRSESGSGFKAEGSKQSSSAANCAFEPPRPVFKTSHSSQTLIPEHLKRALVPILAFSSPSDLGSSAKIVQKIPMNMIRLPPSPNPALSQREEVLAKVEQMDLAKLRRYWSVEGLPSVNCFNILPFSRKKKEASPDPAVPEVTDYSGKIIQNLPELEDPQSEKSGRDDGRSGR